MSTRRSKEKKKEEAAESEKQLDTHLFTPYGWCIPLPPNFSNAVTIIKAYEASSSPYKTVVEKAIKNGEIGWRDTLDFTARETSGPEDATDVRRYLVVGLSYSGLIPDKLSKNALTGLKRVFVGNVANEANLIKLPTDARPIIVVTPVTDEKPARTNFYALVCPKKNLCTPCQIGKHMVFYLARFRDNTTTFATRGTNWNELILAEAFRPALDPVTSSKSRRVHKAKTSSKLVLEPVLSIRNQLSLHISCFLQSKETWHLEQALAVLKQAETDLAYMPPPSNEALLKFLDLDEASFDEGDAEKMIAEVEALWPGSMQTTPSDLVLVKQQIQRDKLFIEYRLVRGFLTQVAISVRTGLEDDLPVNFLVKEVLRVTKTIMGETAIPKPLPVDEHSRLLISILKALRDIKTAGDRFQEGLQDDCGDALATGNLEDIWKKAAECVDQDGLRLWMGQAGRYLIAAKATKERGLGELVGDLVEVMEKLKLE
jgi:hypothetical protein